MKTNGLLLQPVFYVKKYLDEREKKIFICIDFSGNKCYNLKG